MTALTVEMIRPLVDAALAEDVGRGDVTTLATVGETVEGEGRVVARETGVICGLPVAREVFLRVDPGLVFESDVRDGDPVDRGDGVARIRGRARGILTAERTALNFLQHLSGIATATREAVTVLEGTDTRILDTRKTIPGFRLLAKYAVRCGGGENHRRGLDDMILIKDNHLEASGGIRQAVRAGRSRYPDLEVEVEVRSLRELEEALEAEPDRILLDNFQPAEVSAAVERVRARERERGRRPRVEVSGGVTLETLRGLALPGVDFISSGALTHSPRALDLSLELSIRGGGGTR